MGNKNKYLSISNQKTNFIKNKQSKMNLYLVSTKRLGQFYVVANNATEAEDSLTKIFDDQDYGFKKDRRVINIEWLAEAFKPDYRDNKKPFLSDKETRLLIAQHWI